MNFTGSLFKNDKLLFLGIPLLIFLFPHIFLITGGYETWVMPDPREIGFVENATALFLFLGGLYGFYLSIFTHPRDVNFFRTTVLLIGILSLWLCLEEISFGQHLLHLNAPDWFVEHNYNQEINIHNLARDRVSHTFRTTGYITVIIVGIAAPLAVKFMKNKFSKRSWFYYFIPTPWMIVPSLFHLFANLPKNILKLIPGKGQLLVENSYFRNSGEYEEYMFAIWVILYLVMVHRSVMKREAID